MKGAVASLLPALVYLNERVYLQLRRVLRSACY